MQAIRQIIDVNNHTFNIKLPNNFDAKKVEVIILPYIKGNDSNNDDWNTSSKAQFLEGYSDEDSIYDTIKI